MSKVKIDELMKKVEKYKNISLDEVNINEVKDLTEIKISRRKSSNDKILDFLNSVENPYVFKINDTLVKIEFSNNKKTAENCITNAIKNIYE